jgi:hypothetical protein
MPAPTDLAITYELSGAGWATVTLAVPPQRAVMAVSYLSTPLEDLAGAALSLLGRWGAESPRSFTWEGEPEQWDLHLEPRPAGPLHLRVLRRDDARAASSAVIFDGQVPRPAFVREVRRAMDRLRESLGPKEYEARWRRPFPEDLHRRLAEASPRRVEE